MEEKKTDSLSAPAFASPITPPKIAPKRPAVKSSTSVLAETPVVAEDITISTMQDDLSMISNSPKTVAPSTKEMSSNTTPPVAHEAKTFPLPPKNANKQQKVILSPRLRRSRNWLLRGGLALGAVVLLIGGGMGIWYWLSSPSSLNSPVSSDVATVIPSVADLVMLYSFPTSQDKADITAIWDSYGQASFSTLLQGDPRLLLTETDSSQVLYVALPNDPRPYVVIPHTASTEKVLTDTYDVSVTEQNGWYIAHQLDPAPFVEALKTGSLAGTKQAELLQQVVPDNPLRLLVRSGTLQHIRQAFGNKNTEKGSLQAVHLTIKPSTTGKAFLFEGSGETSTVVPTSALTVSEKVLSTLPVDVHHVYMGGDFATDVLHWQETSTPFPENILAQSSVDQLLKSLRVPYAWYTRTGPDTVPDTGIVIDLSTLPTPLLLKDLSLEQGLAATVPLFLEKTLTTPIAFKDGVYGDVPLRFVNILGSTVALDYAIFNNYLLISSSKEGMLTLIDTVAKKVPSALTSTTWQPLFTEWGAVPASRNSMFGTFDQFVLKKLLPFSKDTADTPLIFASEINAVNGQVMIKGFSLKK